MSEIVLTRDNFEKEVLQSDKPVLVDFKAVWCGPCRMMSPLVEEIAEEYAGQVVVGTVDIDEQPGLASIYEIAAVPTFMAFRGGRAVGTRVGVTPKEELLAMLQL